MKATILWGYNEHVMGIQWDIFEDIFEDIVGMMGAVQEHTKSVRIFLYSRMKSRTG